MNAASSAEAPRPMPCPVYVSPWSRLYAAPA
eukprot:CAMPEP_0202857438 /NCGR_PEP_ID=MMETSP1391-20130828/376_1 /ASSEMBLY_ACC=CAM_ASM_000867 /TAXON_ID=1034604 /ORGANISM="Chlamydomonas leiostraca, Strain SAG 11-49" /LENGTH=30 /DNA_ID= /DNA_START= /DNA_END= /DNA_ORIENTATION=